MKVTAKELVNTLSRAVKDEAKNMGIVVTDENGTWLHIDTCSDSFHYTRYTLAGRDTDHGIIQCRFNEYKKLLAWMKALKVSCQDQIEVLVEQDKSVGFSLRGKKLTVKSFGMVQDYPVAPNLRMPPFEKCVLQGMTYADVAKWGKSLLACASDDSTRPYIYGIGFRKDVLMATDGHRLSLLDLPTIGVRGIDNDQDAFMIPTPAFERLIEEAALLTDKLLPTCNIYMSATTDPKVTTEKYLFVQCGNASRYIRLDAAVQPPPYDFLLSLSKNIVFTPDKASDIVDACKEVKAILNSVEPGIHMGISPSGILVTYETIDLSTENSVAGEWTGNESLSWIPKINVAYLQDAVAQFERPSISFTDKTSCIVVQEKDNPLCTYIMPMRP